MLRSALCARTGVLTVRIVTGTSMQRTLRTLDADHNALTSLADIAELRRLESLHLAGNAIDQVEVSWSAGTPQVGARELNVNGRTDAGGVGGAAGGVVGVGAGQVAWVV